MLVTNTETQRSIVQIAGVSASYTGTRHWDLLRFLLGKADRTFIASPFLMDDPEALFAGLPLEGHIFELVTAWPQLGLESLNQAAKLLHYGDQIQKAAGSWPLLHVDLKLHTKAYLFWKGSQPFAGVVTSANLTHAGLQRQHETGILVTEPLLIDDLARSIRGGLSFRDIAPHQLQQLATFAEVAGRHLGPPPPKSSDPGMVDQLAKYLKPAGLSQLAHDRFVGYYIKVSGTKEQPIVPEDPETWSHEAQRLTFAIEPKNMRQGSALIEVAVGGKCFLSYYRSTSVPARMTDEDAIATDCVRWPYFVYATNLSPHYGEGWFKAPLFYQDLEQQFAKDHPGIPVTAGGKASIKGAISIGNSFFAITPEFGAYVMAAIDRWKDQPVGPRS